MDLTTRELGLCPCPHPLTKPIHPGCFRSVLPHLTAEALTLAKLLHQAPQAAATQTSPAQTLLPTPQYSPDPCKFCMPSANQLRLEASSYQYSLLSSPQPVFQLCKENCFPFSQHFSDAEIQITFEEYKR